MAFSLESTSRYRININTVSEAEKQLGRKFLKYNISGITEDNHQSIFDELLEYCEGFATDYWSAGRTWNSADPNNTRRGYYFMFMNQEDAVTFKMIAGAFADYDHIKAVKPFKRPKPKRTGATTPYEPPELMLKLLRRMSTKVLLHFQDACYNNDGNYDANGIIVYLDDINYVLKDRKIK